MSCVQVRVVFIIAIAWWQCVVSPAQAHSCGTCDVEACTPAVNCSAGVVSDVCDCCWVCAKAKGELCKGPHDLGGKCGDGLTCMVRVDPGKFFTGHEEGMCQETPPATCTKKLYSGCSISSSNECFCEELESCTDVHFQFANLAECKAEISRGDKCKDVICPTDDIICPDDSYKLPGIKHLDDCCSTSQGCDCLPETNCPRPICNSTEIPKVVKLSKRIPGLCCPVYQCVSETTCIHDGKVYTNLEKWEDKCYIYLCRNGVVERDKKPCNSSHSTCGTAIIPVDGCCPVCTGCVASGKFYNNNDRWKEDNGCTNCICENGHVECRAEMCHATCKNPVLVPGQCCGICPEPDYVTIPPYCPHLRNCSKQCYSGLQKDMNGCYICDCQPNKCTIQCQYGYAKDSFGEPLCLCAEKDVRKCPPFSCRRKCPNGYKVASNNCTVCKCNHCKKLNACSKECPRGFLTDKLGCKICQCLEDKHVVPSNKCQSSDGRWYDYGQSWNDGCRNCICMEGQELCSLIFCPNPRCKHPTIYKGECCAKCLDDDFTVVHSTLSVCHADLARSYVQGEIWSIDHCTSCVCHGGRFLCGTQQCPPSPCEHPVILDGCCPKCLDFTVTPSEDETLQCYANDGKTTYQHGQQWRASDCQSCYCESSEIKCFSESCPKLLCSRPLLQKNKCCPICPDQINSTSYCVNNNTFYADGEHWILDKCTTCECHHGIIKCIQKHCSNMCYDSAYNSHPCCSDCIENPSQDYKHKFIIIGSGILIGLLGLSVILCALCIFCRRRLHEKSPNILILHTKDANLDDSKSVQCKLITRLPDIMYSGNS